MGEFAHPPIPVIRWRVGERLNLAYVHGKGKPVKLVFEVTASSIELRERPQRIKGATALGEFRRSASDRVMRKADIAWPACRRSRRIHGEMLASKG
jgi:hypothetical protein